MDEKEIKIIPEIDESEIQVEQENIIINTSGTSNYDELINKPQINDIELIGNKTLDELGIQPKGDYALTSDIPTSTSDLENDSGFITSETDPTVPNFVKAITEANITSWNNKQDLLTAGENITIENNVISATTGGGGSEDNAHRVYVGEISYDWGYEQYNEGNKNKSTYKTQQPEA